MAKNDLFDFENIEENPTGTNEDVFDFSEVVKEKPATDVDIKEPIIEIKGKETIKPEDTKIKTTTETIPEITTETTTETTTEGKEEDIDLGELFDSLDEEIETSTEALDKIETAGGDSIEIGTLRDSLKRMEDQLKKINNEKADLKFKNAELEAFSVNDADPKLMVIVSNFSKAKDGDDRSKSKTITALKDMLYDLTGEDFDETKINKDIDMLTASEMYNNKVNPKLKIEEDKDLYGEIMV